MILFEIENKWSMLKFLVHGTSGCICTWPKMSTVGMGISAENLLPLLKCQYKNHVPSALWGPNV